jgi:hypothetical protein
VLWVVVEAGKPTPEDILALHHYVVCCSSMRRATTALSDVKAGNGGRQKRWEMGVVGGDRGQKNGER